MNVYIQGTDIGLYRQKAKIIPNKHLAKGLID